MNAETPRASGASELTRNDSTAAASAAPYVLAESERAPSQLAYETHALGDDTTEAAVLALLRAHGPLVDDELCRAYAGSRYRQRSPQRIRTARAQLVRMGLVQAAGRWLSDSGNPATLWDVAQ